MNKKTKKKRAELTDPRTAVSQIIKCLERAQALSHYRSSEVFDDWLLIVEASLQMLPKHLEMIKTDGRMLRPDEEPDDVRERWRRMQKRYHDKWPKVAELFSEAFHLLMEAADFEYNDWLGKIYMQWEISSDWQGQYFTPWDVALMMAQMTDPTPTIHEHINAALMHKDNILGHAVLLTSVLHTSAEEAERYFFEHVIPAAIPFYQPVTVQEPCVGSGVMLLALASVVPQWANRYGLIQYYGQDIDETCVRMANIQMMLYGLNNYALRCEIILAGMQVAVVPADGEEVTASAVVIAPTAEVEVEPVAVADVVQASFADDVATVASVLPPRPGPAKKIKKTDNGSLVVQHDLFG
jgi:hypothetical protein